MIKELTKKEILKSNSNVEYYKLHFGNQWFMVVPWHYKPAKLMDVFEVCSKTEEGMSYDIKWRTAKIQGRPATLITSITLAEEEFVWDGAEEGHVDSSNSSSDTPSSSSNGSSMQSPTYEPYEAPMDGLDAFHDIDDLDGVPF